MKTKSTSNANKNALNNDLRQYRTWGLTLLQLMALLAVSGFGLTALLNYFL